METQNKIPQFISTKKAGARLDVSSNTLRKLIRDGHIRAMSVGRLIKVDAQSVEEFISKNVYGA